MVAGHDRERYQNLTNPRETHINACHGLGYFIEFRVIYFLSYILREKGNSPKKAKKLTLKITPISDQYLG